MSEEHLDAPSHPADLLPDLPEAPPPGPDAGEVAGEVVAPAPARPRAVVGIGGSAGALDGYERFFLGLPPGGGMAYVIVPHLDPEHRGLMTDILRRCTPMPVVQVEDGTELRPDHVYVIPPGRSLTLRHGTLLLDDLEAAQGRTIDTFFASLAADQGTRAVGVVLSGTGSDGTRGVQAIREAGGLVFVQDPEGAQYPAMPQSAAATGLANEVLPAEDLAPRLHTLVTRAPQGDPAEGTGAGDNAPLQKILRLVRARVGHDFSGYKRSTLVRRIDRRMKGHLISDVAQYARFLQENPAEVEALFADFTINVTSFFRDEEAFGELQARLREYILTFKGELDTFRVWVAGCSTGEEAYSVAIVLHELLEEVREERTLKVQIFATDIDREAVERARLGLYPREIAYVVSPERLRRYFTPREEGYQVRAEVRDLLVFATHNTFGDPPFTRLDLLCCRNLLIYLGPELQRQVMALFHYALRPGGLLFLGASETVGPERERFTALHPRWKIFRRGEGPAGPLPVRGGGTFPALAPAEGGGGALRRPGRAVDVTGQAQSLLLAEYAPPAVVVNESGEILFVNGRTARYLELPSGRTMTNLFEMARDGLRYELPAAVRQAWVRREAVRTSSALEVGGVMHMVDVTVWPLHGPYHGLMMIVFQDRPAAAEAVTPPEKRDRVLTLEHELQYTEESLQATIEEMAVSMEETKSSNEELQTTNEELQSSNEELTTSKEELQSLNEELITINAEHQRVITDLAQANDDMKNLLESAGIATVFLSNDLRIKRFTPRITRVINLMPVDVGRPITDISVNLRYDNLTADIGRVVETLETFETQVQTLDGAWYLMRVSPYRTSDNFIDGVVLAFTSIDTIKTLERRVRESSAVAEAALDATQDPVLILDSRLRVVTANRALHALLHTTPAGVNGEFLSEINHFALDLPDLLARLRDVIATEEPMTAFVVNVNLPYGGQRKMKTEAAPLRDVDGQSVLFLLKLEDVTELLRRAAHEGEDLTGDVSSPPGE
ncbi:CheR family methyltransferase [Deinococcus sp. YIM 134068]|uniref:CheR family methyltransferase n=1 Tax=Deinococcus lichenicola TaxID=3118910 RepID=UPI002F95F92F